jgi:nucleoside-diphosphate-sugar epimerase
LLAQGHDVRTLDVVPVDDPIERDLIEIRGDMRDSERAKELCDGADVLVHAAAALPIRGSRQEIMSVNVDGTATLLAAAVGAVVRRVVYISSTAVYGVPKVHPLFENFPLVGVGPYGESKIACEGLVRSSPLETVIIRPKTFLGPERLGVFEILFDWIRDGRRIYVLGRGGNRYQLLAVEDLVDVIDRASTADVAGEVFNVGATEFGTVRSDLESLIAHAGTSSRLRPVPARPAELALRALELARLSPLGEWHYKTASRDSFVDVSKAERLLGWQATKSNVETLVENYDWYVANRAGMQAAGVTHRVPWNQQALSWLKKVS